MFTDSGRSNIKNIYNDLQNKPLVIFGAGSNADWCMKVFKTIGGKISCIVDNNVAKEGMLFFGKYKIISFKTFAQLYKQKRNEYIIIITMSDMQDALTQLQMEYANEFHFYTYGFLRETFPYVQEIWGGENGKKYQVDYESQLQIWVENLQDEINFWQRYEADPNGIYHMDYITFFEDRIFECARLERNHIELHGGETVLDIGCGIHSQYGTLLKNGNRINLKGIDPLSYYYKQLNNKFAPILQQRKNIEIKFGLFEWLTHFLSENSADIILVDNAMDHCIDPVKSILECLKVVKLEKGVLSIRHNFCEALNGNYMGLHQWNMDVDQSGNFIVWNDNSYANISQMLNEIATIEIDFEDADQYTTRGMVCCTIRKKKDFVIEEIYHTNEKETLALLLAQLMEKIIGLKI